MRGWKYILHRNGNQKKAGLEILISDKIGFKIETITRDKGHYIVTKWSIQEKDMAIGNKIAGYWEDNRQEGQWSPNGGNRLQLSDIFISV